MWVYVNIRRAFLFLLFIHAFKSIKQSFVFLTFALEFVLDYLEIIFVLFKRP